MPGLDMSDGIIAVAVAVAAAAAISDARVMIVSQLIGSPMTPGCL